MKLFASIQSYLKGVREEAGRISWPTRKEATRDVIALIVFCVIVAIFLGIVDFGFLQGVKLFLVR